MKTKTILTVLKYLALLGGVKYSIEFGGQLTSFVASFINPDWAKRTYEVNLDILGIREHSSWYYGLAMCILIVASALKATVWYVVFGLLSKLKLQTPFSMDVEKKLESVAFLLLGVWVVSSFVWKTYVHYLSKDLGMQLPVTNNGDEYFFIAGIVYIMSQVFKRGIEMQEENQLTV